MDRVNAILNDKEYKKYLNRIKEWEKKRHYCKHNMKHFMDVARIAYILTLEEKIKVDKEVIYAIGLLHDIGRHVQYEDKTPHEKASAILAPGILKRCGFDKAEEELIISCISNHRNKENQGGSLEQIIYRADKLSRPCYECKYEKDCNWEQSKKNMGIDV